MNHLGLVTKQTLGCGALLLIGGIAVYCLCAPPLRRHHELEQRRRLEDLALALDAFGSPPATLLDQQLKGLAQQCNVAVTRLSPRGDVLAEAFPSPATAPLQAWPPLRGDDPEVSQAARLGSWDTVRRGPTGQSFRRHVRRIGAADQTPGFLSITAREFGDPIAGLILSRILATGLLVGLASLGWTAWTAWRLREAILELNRAADAISRGEAVFAAGIHRGDELGRLASAFERMGRLMGRRMSEIQDVGDQLSAVLRGMSDAVVAIDERRSVLFANPAAQHLFGVDAAGMTGRKLAELVRHRILHEAIAQYFATGTARRLELAWGAERRSFSVTLTELPGRDQTGLILEFHDLTELRRLESLRQEFIANVSHELKTPLSSIKAYAETLREGAVSDPDHCVDFIRQIESQADRLHELILDMISLARIEGGEQTFDIVPVSLRNAAQRCLSAYSDAAKRHGLQLTVDAESDVRVRVLADEEGLRQILDNLVDNAVKYTPSGGSVVIRWHVRQETPQVVLEVEDTGLGIPAAAQARVFERFFRVDKARSRILGGTGLGLSIVKHLVQAFGGTVSVWSQVGKGSRFSVFLRLSQEPPPET